jgi:hypothetical protein
MYIYVYIYIYMYMYRNLFWVRKVTAALDTARVVQTVTQLVVTFEVLTALKMSISILRLVMLCGLAGRQQRFGRAYCLRFQG